ncbi:MAG: hypothetical protein J6B80_02880 [Clostridia bacterium]|nr:hypothetical protein [Clostridia bacterium]
MPLKMYSFYDSVSKQSVCINFYRDDHEAQREALHILESIPEYKRKDIKVFYIGTFNTETLVIEPNEPYLCFSLEDDA